jgi:tetratricopeptide (TPR) repeat protein
MPSSPDPFQPHLNRAASLFQEGEAVQAGQIWQAILKRDPANQAARAGLYQVKLWLERNQAKTDIPQPDQEQLLREGCTLYDMGQMQDALRKWERILAADPQHKLALAYANDARRELGLAALEGSGAPPPQVAEGPAREQPGQGPADAAPGADQLVLEGVQIYDMGMVEEAMTKWERALKAVPDHKDALAYLEMARRDQEQTRNRPPARPAPAETAKTVIDPGIWRAEQLLHQNRLEEAAQAFQRLLDRDSRDPRVLQGYHQARALLNARSEPQSITLVQLDRPAAKPAIPAPVGPPPAVTARSAPHRNGFKLPWMLQGKRLPPWLNTPRNLALAGGLLFLGILGAVLYGEHRREAALREAVAAAKITALRPVARMTQIPVLAQSTEEVRQEAGRAMPDDPLLAYFRAEEWQRREPDSTAATDLVAQAKAGIATLKRPVGTLPDFEKALQGGDLDGALRCMLGLLQQAPDDPELRSRARVVLLALAPIYAAKERFDDARDALRLGRAMYPMDKNWPAKLKLLESIQTMAKPDRTPWIPLLG